MWALQLLLQRALVKPLKLRQLSRLGNEPPRRGARVLSSLVSSNSFPPYGGTNSAVIKQAA
jgi:hypothetical protein